MSVSQSDIGKHLQSARKACRMTQDDVAKYLDVSRSTIAQMELGNRPVTGVELDRLAYLYGRDVGEFLAREFEEEDVIVALFRVHPEVENQTEVMEAFRSCLAVGREVTNLERLLGIDRDLGAMAAYPLPEPKSKWDAIRQGERIAAQERRRLGLGYTALPDISELLETQGVRTAQISLPEDLSGVTLIEPAVGIFVVANRRHHILRRRFSYSHEYCHVLADRDQRGTVSRSTDRDNLLEVRANSFAASFLMPTDGVTQFVHGLGKGRPSRLQAEIFDEEEPVQVQSRSVPGSQDIQMYDVVQLAHHFGVSRQSALYRLRNLRMITDAELKQLLGLDEQGKGVKVAEALDLPEPNHREARNEFRHRFLALGLEALRRGEITRAKLRELAAMVEVSGERLDRLLQDAALSEADGGVDVMLPED